MRGRRRAPRALRAVATRVKDRAFRCCPLELAPPRPLPPAVRWRLTHRPWTALFTCRAVTTLRLLPAAAVATAGAAGRPQHWAATGALLDGRFCSPHTRRSTQWPARNCRGWNAYSSRTWHWSASRQCTADLQFHPIGIAACALSGWARWASFAVHVFHAFWGFSVILSRVCRAQSAQPTDARSGGTGSYGTRGGRIPGACAGMLFTVHPHARIIFSSPK